MIKKIVRSRFFYRLAESFVPLLTWTVITFPVWFSPFHPAIVSYFILAFTLYFMFKSVRTVYFAYISFHLMNKASRVDWLGRLIKHGGYSKVVHFFLITNYKEQSEKVEKTITRIKEQKYPKIKENVHLVLAMEEREGEEAKARSKQLTKKFAKYFAGFYTTYHRLEEGEVIGKASNETFAAKFIDRKVKKMRIDPRKVLITICDADSLLPLKYLSYLTFEFLADEERDYHFYWAPVLLYNNFWQLSFLVRIHSILSSILRFSFLSQKEDLIQISTYTTNLWLLRQVGFWHTDIIPEDWHIWLQAFFKFGEKVRTMPIYLPVSADAVIAKGIFKTFKSRYEQEKRWAWGASDIPYAIKKSFETPQIKPLIKLRKLILLIETHLFWPTAFFVLTLSSSIPPLVNPVFKRTVMGFLLPKLASAILTISSFLLLFVLYFDHKMREKMKVKTRLRNLPLLFVQWYFLPLVSFVFASLPALEAHTRLLLGKKIEYKVTEKD